mmetsp:Transcript_107635/g.303146  ORF Transcript_107635/g.303146 Transcript_107635/m.303146 type:complete len:779 (-) Transcript_107635:20-2356(-)
MGRGINGDVQNRRKGPAGTGQNRKREKRIRDRSAKDRQEQLASFHAKQKTRLKHAAHVAGADDKADATSQSTGFEKAVAGQVGASQVTAVPFDRFFWKGAPQPPGEPSDALKLQRKELGVKVRGAPVPPPVDSFTDASLPKAFADFFHARRGGGRTALEKPTPIQAQVWPAALCGVDVIGIAPTGSGKTLAYILPSIPHMLAHRDKHLRGPSAKNAKTGGPICLCLAPTRELAKQVSDVCNGGGGSGGGWMKRLFDLRAGAVYGGVGKEEQLDSIVTLGAPQVLCATPGRLLDLLGLGALSMEHVTYLVLDEADRMLALGFEPQLTAITKAIRPNRQALLFSATFPGKLREAAEQWMAAERVIIRVGTMETTALQSDKVGGEKSKDDRGTAEDAAAADTEDEEATAVVDHGLGETGEAALTTSASSTLTVSPTVHQTVHVCANHKKPRKLIKFVEKVRADEQATGVRQRAAILVFCGQIKTLRTVADLLQKHGERCAPLHSGIPQAKREAALVGLKSGKVDTLVATDVASRGLHISRLRHVVNYDFPSNLEVYCHRIGRVGRQGAEGWAYSFFTRNLAVLAPGLVGVLERSKQRVDPNLRAVAEGKDTEEGDLVDDADKNEDSAQHPGAAAPQRGDRRAVCVKDVSTEAAQDRGAVAVAPEAVAQEEPAAECDESADSEEDDENCGADVDSDADSDAPSGGVGIGGGLRIRPIRKRKPSGCASSSSDSEREAGAPTPSGVGVGGAPQVSAACLEGRAASRKQRRPPKKKRRRAQQQQK